MQHMQDLQVHAWNGHVYHKLVELGQKLVRREGAAPREDIAGGDKQHELDAWGRREQGSHI